MKKILAITIAISLVYIQWSMVDSQEFVLSTIDHRLSADSLRPIAEANQDHEKLKPTPRPNTPSTPTDNRVESKGPFLKTIGSMTKRSDQVAQIKDQVLHDMDVQIFNTPLSENSSFVLLRNTFEFLFNDIISKVDQGIIRPDVFLRTRTSESLSAVRNVQTRELRVGVLATAANPLQWGHIWMCLVAISEQNLDTVVILPQGDISYKKVAPADDAPKELRHEMTREALRPFYPLIRYSDVGLENDHIGEENIHALLCLNPDQKINLYYMAGTESIEKSRKSLDNLYRYAYKYSLGSNPNHNLTWLIHFRTGFRENTNLTCEQFLETVFSRLSQSQPPYGTTPVKITPQIYEFPIVITGGTSSTRYRKGERWVALPVIDEYAKENALYGYPETDIVRARKTMREAQRLKQFGNASQAGEKAKECFEFIRQAISKAVRQMASPAKATKLENVEVTAKTPVRLDLASGLGSDLFAVSMEKGGKVLNAAITLNGTKPVQVTVRRIPENAIRIHSADLNETEYITDIKSFDIKDTVSANDPLRLYKAALIEAGIVPESLEGDLTKILEQLGGGLEINGKIEGIPAGSGLGISSILGITLLKALYTVTGRMPTDRELILRTVNLEQRLGNYGGWQDPVGGGV